LSEKSEIFCGASRHHLEPTQTHLWSVWFRQNPQKKSGKYRKKIVKGFARFSENVLFFCRPHNTSVVGANFCGSIFCDPCSEKNKKKLIPTSTFWKKKKKNPGYLLVL